MSALPSVMQQRMQTLKDPENTGVTPGSPAAPAGDSTPTDDQNTGAVVAPTDGEVVTTNAEGERITLSREEYNTLKANSSRVETLQGREKTSALELEELRHRLTELQNSNKAVSNAPAEPAAPAPAVIDAASVQFTDDEEEQYGETREFIEKVVKIQVASILNTLVPELRTAIDEAKKAADGAVGEVNKNNQRSFHERLMAKVPELTTLIKHPQWVAFLDESEPVSGFTYEQLISHNVSNQNLDRTAKIYELFADKYVKPLPTNAGYAGASTGGGAVNDTGDAGKGTKLKYSDREKASKDYRMGRITHEQLQEVAKKFEAAEKAGNVDHNS